MFVGLNPKTCRMFVSRHKLNMNPVRGILDWQLISSFLHLPLTEKVEIAKKIAVKVDDIVDDILEIDRITSLF